MDSSAPIALVTGASSGIGKALALKLASSGYIVYGTSRHHNSIDPTIIPLRLDAADPQSLNAFISENRGLLLKMDLVVNNCGASLYGDITRWASGPIGEQVHLLLQAPIELTTIALQGMRERGRGCIVNVSSLAGGFPLPYMSIYSAAKAGLSAFTQSLILTERTPGIQLIDFQPGDYRTSFNRGMTQADELDEGERRTWEILEKNCSRGPLPEKAAGDIMTAIQKGNSGVVHSGSFFQSRVAVFAKRLVSHSFLRRVMRVMYAIGK